MTVTELINKTQGTAFSFEILPPLKGNSIEKVYNIVDKLIEFDPKYINITTHHSEWIDKEMPDGSTKRVNIRKRPGSVAIAAALQNKYGVAAIPHMICKGFTREETEYAMIDLNFLGVTNLILLRGDEKKLLPEQTINNNEHATDLQDQVNDFNNGIALNGDTFERFATPFAYGMACYPELHEESPDMESELRYMKQKADNGAEYFVTQMFFDNDKYFDFADLCRKAGIKQPIIPGVKPVVLANQLNVLPKIFHLQMPEELRIELEKCNGDDAKAKEVGVEWGIKQCKDLIARGVPSLHFYSLMATESVRRIAKEIF